MADHMSASQITALEIRLDTLMSGRELRISAKINIGFESLMDAGKRALLCSRLAALSDCGRVSVTGPELLPADRLPARSAEEPQSGDSTTSTTTQGDR